MKANKKPSREDILRLTRSVILHSYIYYHLNDNIISDSKYDEMCTRLAKHKDKIKTHRLYEIVKDFTGETGMHLIRRDLDKYHTHWVSLGLWALRYRDEHERNTTTN